MIREYPKFLFHVDGRSAVVGNVSEQEALGVEWHESPQAAADYHAEMAVETLVAQDPQDLQDPQDPMLFSEEKPKGKK